MKLEVKKLPRQLALTQVEQNALASLTHQEQSALPFWKAAFAARKISCPQNRVLLMVPCAPGEYRLEWHSKALGQKAIQQGIEYRNFTARKDKEFAEKLQRRGQEVWS